jgi:hypothetical protein
MDRMGRIKNFRFEISDFKSCLSCPSMFIPAVILQVVEWEREG